jgi:hypothetical protein
MLYVYRPPDIPILPSFRPSNMKEFYSQACRDFLFLWLDLLLRLCVQYVNPVHPSARPKGKSFVFGLFVYFSVYFWHRPFCNSNMDETSCASAGAPKRVRFDADVDSIASSAENREELDANPQTKGSKTTLHVEAIMHPACPTPPPTLRSEIEKYVLHIGTISFMVCLLTNFMIFSFI